MIARGGVVYIAAVSTDLVAKLSSHLAHDPLALELLGILAKPTGISSSGYPFLQQEGWERFRDRIPHILNMGARTHRCVASIRAAIGEDTSEQAENLLRACKVVDQVVMTSAITAPPSLWLARNLLSSFKKLGLLQRLLRGEAIYPDECEVDGELLSSKELYTDLLFFLSLGFVEQYDDSFRIAGHPRARRIFEAVEALEDMRDPVSIWLALFRDDAELEAEDKERLLSLGFSAVARTNTAQNHWLPTLSEIELGYRLVPVVLGLRATGKSGLFEAGKSLSGADLSTRSPICAVGALEILTAAGWCEREGEGYRVTAIGARGFKRGPGPFGIIHTYHPYMEKSEEILREGTAKVWVQRGDNVAASQDANKGTFLRANKALDRFIEDTGFELKVFIEHAIGRGEATRQRYERSGAEKIRYVGADLEDAAIDAAVEEQAAGNLPENMIFVRNADIGKAATLIDALVAEGIETRGAVMMVGNGFHEIRNQSDESMRDVFKAYCDAGIILLFTEENALSIDDIRQTAWNTYHAAFKYVHEKSGQGLRPAHPRPGARLGKGLRAAWSECARAGGYRRVSAYCDRTRTIYPYTPKNGLNPSISTNLFFVPEELAQELGLGE